MSGMGEKKPSPWGKAPVVELSAEKWTAVNKRSKWANKTPLIRSNLWMVLFYSSADVKRRDLIQTWAKFAKKTKNIVKVGAVDCKIEKSMCGKFAKKFPSILLFPPHKKQPEKFTLEKGAKALAAEGENAHTKTPKNKARLSPDLLRAFAYSRFPFFMVTTLSSQAGSSKVGSFLNKDKTRVILIRPDVKASPLVQKLAVKFAGLLEFALVSSKDQQLLDSLQKFISKTTQSKMSKSRKLPHMFILHGKGSAAKMYDFPAEKKMSHREVDSFLTRFAKKHITSGNPKQ